eukprot:TRINITY_DN92446_c0_g1_i1.p1 TRINITY_DN92446_c0_g1~~TRINITY_DN92446_c0_g1_i1.p1  ORF type:complete len:612 (-),score=78.79 TRINITY_DN92446_c0_g1_i1:145-1980(-)
MASPPHVSPMIGCSHRRRRDGCTMSMAGLASLLQVTSCAKEKQHAVFERSLSFPQASDVFAGELESSMAYADGHQEAMDCTSHLALDEIDSGSLNALRVRSPASLMGKVKLQPLAFSPSACSDVAACSLADHNNFTSPAMTSRKINLLPLDDRSEAAVRSLGQSSEVRSSRSNSDTSSVAEGKDAASDDMDRPEMFQPPSSSQSADRTTKERPRRRQSVPHRRRSSSCASTGLPLRKHQPDSDVEGALSRKERVAAFEAARLENVHHQNRRLNKLLKVHQAALAKDVQPQNNVAQRKAAYEAKRQDAMKLHKEHVQRVKDLVRARLEEWKPAEEFIQLVVSTVLSVAGLDVDAYCTGREVTPEMIEQCCNESKHRHFSVYLDAALKGQHGVMSEAWRIAFISEIMRLRSIGELTEASGEGFAMMLCETVEQLTNAGSPVLACSICMDPIVSVSDGRFDASEMWCAPLRKNEHWSNHPCGHTFCRACMRTWAQTAINDHKLRIKCPAENCCYSLMEQDIQGLVSNTVFNRYLEYKHADYLQNLRTITAGDDQLMRWLRQHAKPCPNCHVIVSRSEGCNVMTCVCGTRFCYACGCQQCQCGKKQRDDIWRPQD